MAEQSDRDRSTEGGSADDSARSDGEVCPRCSGDLAWFRLDDRAAAVCEACGYVGVPVDHHARGDATAAWDDAVERARPSAADAAVETATDGPDPTIEALFDPIDSSPYRLDGWDEGGDGGSETAPDTDRATGSDRDAGGNDA